MDSDFPTDSVLQPLKQQRALHHSCQAAAFETASGTDALNLATKLMFEAGYGLASIEPAANLIAGYRGAKGHLRRWDRLIDEVSNIEYLIEARIRALQYKQLFNPLAFASPVRPLGLGADELLPMICPEDGGMILYSSIMGKEPRLWTHDTADDVDTTADWYWPMPVRYTEETDEENLIRCPEAVSEWTSATTLLDPTQIEALPEGLVSGRFRVRTLVSTADLTASTTFAVNAQNKKEWHAECNAIKNAFAALGLKKPNFRYDWLAHMPGGGVDNKLVYSNP